MARGRRSLGSVESCPGLLAALAELGPGDVLKVGKRDRLGRDAFVMALIEKMVTKQGARIVSAAGGCSDGDDPASMMRRMLDGFAEYERLIIGARTKTTLAAKKRRWERVGKAPFGFDLADDGKTLVENDLEQRAIGYIEDQRTQDKSFRKIAHELEAIGTRQKNGQRRWTNTPVAIIARRERA